MAGFSYSTNEHLVRSNLWSTELKEVLLDKLYAMQWVDWLTDFPDGDTINIPSIGQMETLNYQEGEVVRYQAMDTGNFTFTIGKYKSSATFITNKMKQDSYYTNRLISQFVPKQARAIGKVMEVDFLATGPLAQTAANLNTINGAPHRWVGQGTNQIITVNDFAKAKYALDKANVPESNRIAVVDPSVEYALNTLTNITNVINNPQWQGIITSGMSDGMRFSRNIYGFDIYVSNNLNANATTETINAVVAPVNAANNIFFSADSTALPIVGCVRQPPQVDSEYEKDLQREEYVTTCRYDFKLFRPENMVTVLTDTTQI
jgi:hypothetical protein